MGEITAERITVTVSARNGLALINLDATRRLGELGYRRIKGRGLVTSPHDLTQQEFLNGYPAIRDLDHYRQLVADDRSAGPLVQYPPRASLLMERAEMPKSKRVWYVVLDTAIGATPKFLAELRVKRSITIKQEKGASGDHERL